MNTNIQEIKLGAPAKIEAGACPNANLQTQIALNIKELILHDENSKCTEDGAIIAAVKLLRKKMEEKVNKESTWEGMAIQYDNNYIEFISHGGSIQLSLLNEGTLVSANNVYWFVDIEKAEEGATAIISSNGILTTTVGKDISGTVKVISKQDLTMQVCIQFYILHSQIERYPALSDVFTQRPELISIVYEYPEVINSLIDTGMENWLVGDRQSYIDTGYHIKNTDTVEADFVFLSSISQQSVFGGNNTYRVNQNNNGKFEANVNPINSARWLALTPNTSVASKFEKKLFVVFNDEANRVCIYENNMLVTSANLSLTEGECTNTLFLFDSPQYNKPSNGKISHVRCYDSNGDNFNFIPFKKQDGRIGMLDLVDLTFYPNAGSGQFTLITEPK